MAMLPAVSFHEVGMERLIQACQNSEEECVASASICLINATGFGCEALKNLVIPGLAYFKVIDPTHISVDAGYFFEECPTGEPTAHACVRLMQRLNEDVKGEYMEANVASILESNPIFFKSFDLVIATNLKESEVIQLSKSCWEESVPLIYARCLNFFGSLRVQIKEQITVNKEFKFFDLRLHKPFPALKDFLENTPMAEKAPWLMVMNKYLRQWQDLFAGEGRIPADSAELQDLVALMETHESEEVFEEAAKMIEYAFNFNGEPTDNLLELFEAVLMIDEEQLQQPFWIIMTVIRDFVHNQNDGLLPLSGVLPKQFQTDDKISADIAEIYKQKSLEDVGYIYEQCQTFIRSMDLPEDFIKMKMITALVTELPNLGYVSGKPLYEEYERVPFNLGALEEDEDFSEDAPFIQSYVGFRAFERFLEKYNKAPKDDDIGNEVDRFRALAIGLFAEWNINAEFNDELLYEICNYGASELEATSTHIGGCASDLATKLLSNQHIDLEGTLMFSGINSNVKTLTF